MYIYFFNLTTSTSVSLVFYFLFLKKKVAEKAILFIQYCLFVAAPPLSRSLYLSLPHSLSLAQDQTHHLYAGAADQVTRWPLVPGRWCRLKVAVRVFLLLFFPFLILSLVILRGAALLLQADVQLLLSSSYSSSPSQPPADTNTVWEPAFLIPPGWLFSSTSHCFSPSPGVLLPSWVGTFVFCLFFVVADCGPVFYLSVLVYFGSCQAALPPGGTLREAAEFTSQGLGLFLSLLRRLREHLGLGPLAGGGAFAALL